VVALIRASTNPEDAGAAVVLAEPDGVVLVEELVVGVAEVDGAVDVGL
jgi:hypothetical protein